MERREKHCCLEPRTSNPKSENRKRVQILDGLVILASLVGVVASSYFITEGAIGLAEKWE